MEKKQEKPEKEGKEQPAVTCTAAHHNPNHSQTHIYPTQRLITIPAIPHGVRWRDSSDPEIYRHPDSLSSIATNKGCTRQISRQDARNGPQCVSRHP